MPPFDVVVKGRSNTAVSSFAFPSPKVHHIVTSRSTTRKSARFRGRDIALRPTLIQPITAWHSLAPQSFTRTSNNISLRFACYEGEDTGYHVPHMRHAWGKFCPSSDDHACRCIPIGKRDNQSCAFWLKPVSAFGLFLITTFSSSFLTLTIPRSLAPYPP